MTMSIDILRLRLLYRSSTLCGMNQLDRKRRAAIVAALVEGNSIRATCRMTGAAKGTGCGTVKLYGEAPEAEKRYSPAQCIGCHKTRIEGNPDPRHVSTSFVERQNLTMRMSMRRFTRLTNAFSKKVENLEAAVALHFMWHNFGRVHQTLRVTPAMEAGVTDHVWTLEEMVALLDQPAN
jgi:hypothetical protein